MRDRSPRFIILSVVLLSACVGMSRVAASPDTQSDAFGQPCFSGWRRVRIREDGSYSGLDAGIGRSGLLIGVADRGKLVALHCEDASCSATRRTALSDQLRSGQFAFWTDATSLPLAAYESRSTTALKLLDCLDDRCSTFRQTELGEFEYDTWDIVRHKSDVLVVASTAPNSCDVADLVLLRCANADCSKRTIRTIAKDVREGRFAITTSNDTVAVAYVDALDQAGVYRCNGSFECAQLRFTSARDRGSRTRAVSVALHPNGQLWLGTLDESLDTSRSNASRVKLVRCGTVDCATVQSIDVEPIDTLRISVSSDGRIIGALRNTASGVLYTSQCDSVKCGRIDIQKQSGTGHSIVFGPGGTVQFLSLTSDAIKRTVCTDGRCSHTDIPRF